MKIVKEEIIEKLKRKTEPAKNVEGKEIYFEYTGKVRTLSTLYGLTLQQEQYILHIEGAKPHTGWLMINDKGE